MNSTTFANSGSFFSIFSGYATEESAHTSDPFSEEMFEISLLESIVDPYCRSDFAFDFYNAAGTAKE